MKISFLTPKYNIYKMPSSMMVNNPIHFRAKEDSLEKENYTYHNIKLPQKISRPGTRKSTLKKLDNVYEKYKSSLLEISKDEIYSTIEKLHNQTGYSKEHIEETMQDLTQFGSINSVIKIGKELEKYNIGLIASFVNEMDINVQYDNTSNWGLNNTLNYLIKKKKFGKLFDTSKQNAIFLDNNKLAQYEILKKKDPEQLEKIVNSKNNHFFILSGFNEGINFLNISQETLENKTREALALDDINRVTKDRAKALGINPIVIENKKGDVYEQLKPEQISKEEMLAVIDANLITLHNNPNARVDLKDDIVQYLDNSLEVYTPLKLSKDLREMYSKIEKIVTAKNKKMDDVVYIIPFSAKSYDYINYQYQLVNNIPPEKFVEIHKKGYLPKEEDKLYVLLDDSNISGNSMRVVLPSIYDTFKMNNKNNNSNLIIAPIYSTVFAIQDTEYLIEECCREGKDVLLKQNPLKAPWYYNVKDEDALVVSLGEQFFEGELKKAYPCIIFPYMAPDNNSELASNIALYHSPVYRENPMALARELRPSIKSYSDNAEHVARLAEKFLNRN